MICNQDMTCGWNVEQNKPSLYKQHMNYLEMDLAFFRAKI